MVFDGLGAHANSVNFWSIWSGVTSSKIQVSWSEDLFSKEFGWVNWLFNMNHFLKCVFYEAGKSSALST